MNNILFSIKVDINKDTIDNELINAFNTDRIYSYIVTYNNDKFLLKYDISETDNYNTILSTDAIIKIKQGINDYNYDKELVCFKQPPLELIYELYNNFIIKLAAEQYNRWPNLNLEDLAQDCRLVILILYNKGYYLHKRLIRKAFYNQVLLSLRKAKDCPQILSLSEPMGEGDDSEKICLADTIADTKAIEKEKEKELLESRQEMFTEVRDIVIDLIGQRQYDALIRDYGKGHTTAQTRRLMQIVKNKIVEMGITPQDFYNRYY